MRWQTERTRTTRMLTLSALVAGATLLLPTNLAHGEQRQFAVMLAHPPKSFRVGGEPSLPPGGLPNINDFRNLFFDPTNNPFIESFAEYWEEVSYGDVQVSGDVYGWALLPWPIERPPVTAPGSSVEGFFDGVSLIITDGFIASPRASDDPRNPALSSRRLPGLNDFSVSGLSVWTPGEVFSDTDGDEQWDSLDELTDRMCNSPNGCTQACNLWKCSKSKTRCFGRDSCPFGEACVPTGTDNPCVDSSDCGNGELCGDFPDAGPRGCSVRGCGNLAMPCVDWDGDGICNNAAGCVVPQRLKMCTQDSQCDDAPGVFPPHGVCRFDENDPDAPGFCLPLNCVPPLPGGQAPVLPLCCDPVEPVQPCGVPVEGDPGISCGTPVIVCCNFQDVNRNNVADAPEPFVDSLSIGNLPSGPDAYNNYIRNNYPGDVEALIARTGNGWYDSPDLFFDSGDGHMFISGGSGRVPKPGSRGCAGGTNIRKACTKNEDCPGSFCSPRRYSAVDEKAWFDDFWEDRYHTAPPEWPGGEGPDPLPNGIEIIAFQPPTEDAGEGSIQPDTSFGLYDGPVEFDDLPSSKYHSRGDGRLGEVTCPTTDSPSGEDLGSHNPDLPQLQPDGFKVLAGPYAVNIHGQKGYDAGDVAFTEWLTWRTDGQHPTPAYQWEKNHGEHHPFAGVDSLPLQTRCAGTVDKDKLCRTDAHCGGAAGSCTTRRCSASGTPCTQNSHCEGGTDTCSAVAPAYGFRDFNLNGMIDQGTAHAAGTENYASIDDNDYPFNRTRLIEDVVEALDPTLDWDDYLIPDSMAVHLCSHPEETNQVSVSDAASDALSQFSNASKNITAQGFVSGVVILPPNAYRDRELFNNSPQFHPIHNEDNVTSLYKFPDWPTDPITTGEITKSFNLGFHDLVVCANCQPNLAQYAAQLYGETWQGFPSLFDFDLHDDIQADEINCPMGAYDLMTGGFPGAGGAFVHFSPPLKNLACANWIEPVDLTTVLTPGVPALLTLPPAEISRDGYYFLENEDRPGERYWFWSPGLGFDENLPSKPFEGMLIMHFDSAGANPDALPLQQRIAPFSYEIVQADGDEDLEVCQSGGNTGDFGDVWPGSTNNQTFNFNSVPPARWVTQNSWTGLDIDFIQPDGAGSTVLRLSWTPTSLPSLRFINPPGGESAQGRYRINYNATDVYGGTRVRLYYTTNPAIVDPSNAAVKFIGEKRKDLPGTVDLSQDWFVTGVPDGRYYLFAKLVPGVGSNNKTEASNTKARASRNNIGDGVLTIDQVDTGFEDAGKARSETWTVRYFNTETDGTQDWLVYSSLTQPAPQNDPPTTKKCTAVRTGSDPLDPYQHLCLKPSASPLGVQYTSKGGEVKFTLRQCSVGTGGCAPGFLPFAVGDQFTFTTTGITAPSAGILVENGKISAIPTAVITATPLSGSPPLKVDFDARNSTDPNGAPLTYLWSFGDGSATATGATVSHTYNTDGTFAAQLRATNAAGRFSETAVDIHVINNAPHAAFTATPTNGKSPLTVQFNASSSSDTEDAGEDLIYQWDFGDGMTANDQGVVGQFRQTSHVFSKRADGTLCTAASPCNLTAKLTVTDTAGKKDTATLGIRVGNSNPVARVVASPQSGDAPLKVRFNALSSTDADLDPLKVDWTWGDSTCAGRDPDLPNLDIKGNTSANDGTVEHIYKCVGTFTPVVVVKDGKGGESSFNGTQIIVTQGTGTGGGGEAQLVARFRITPSPPLLNQPFTVDGSGSTGTISGYSWNWGDSTPASSGVSPTHSYTAAGSYTIVLTVTGPNNTSAQTSQRVTVAGTGTGEPLPEENHAPTAVILAEPTSGFVGQEFRFDGRRSTDADGDALTYSWTFGDGASGTGPQTTHTYAEPKTYTVRLTVRDAKNASTQVTQNIQVVRAGENRSPVAIIATGPRTGTAPAVLDFDGRNSYDLDGDALTYLWTFQQGTGPVDDMDGQVVTRRFGEPGTYTVVLTVTDAKNASTVSTPVEVRISAPVQPPDDGGVTPPDTGGGEERPVPDSADQRPSTCGIGMVLGLFGSLLGLTSLRVVRRRRPV